MRFDSAGFEVSLDPVSHKVDSVRVRPCQFRQYVLGISASIVSSTGWIGTISLGHFCMPQLSGGIAGWPTRGRRYGGLESPATVGEDHRDSLRQMESRLDAKGWGERFCYRFEGASTGAVIEPIIRVKPATKQLP